jgi:HAE1 family hydrophobic/amphiphilic exporter-1
MNLIRLSIERPTAVIAVVLMVVVFGFVALDAIPIQLSPDITRPVVTIRTPWPGAAPAEVEREIVNRQEEVLSGLEGAVKMDSNSFNGQGRITLEFDFGQDMDKAVLLVANRLDQVSGYPEEADEPVLETAGSDDQPIAWFNLRLKPGHHRDIDSLYEFAVDVVRDRLQRVSGVAFVAVHGGRERELKIVVDPLRLAEYGLTVPAMVEALRAANLSVTAGAVEEGKRRYVVRSEADFQTPAQVAGVLLRTIDDPDTGRVARVTVGDVARIGFGRKKMNASIRHMGEPAISMNAVRKSGANVIETMAGIRAAVAELNAGPVPAEGLVLTQVYDETVYIDSAIELVRSNIWFGGALAAAILLLFLRSLPATLVVTLAIPVSIIGSFVAMAGLGRSINVISLAGLAFAVGMVVDAAIVVLENIFRLRQRGMPAAWAAYEGTRQVWGAVLVSALTTVVVFLPILLLELEVGQLFRDIAVAIVVAVLLSLLVAVTVIPSLAGRLLHGGTENPVDGRRIPGVDRLASGFVRAAIGFARRMVGRPGRALFTVAGVCIVAVVATVLFLPKLEYLPEGNRNLVFGVIVPPPGYSLETMDEIAREIEASVRPLWASETGPQAKPGEPPKFAHFFVIAQNNSTLIGGSAVEPERVGELIPVLEPIAFREPGTFGSISQPALFSRVVSSGRLVELDISGPDLGEILDVARRAALRIGEVLPRDRGNHLRPRPGLELGAPEIRIHPDPLRLADAGLTVREFSETIDAFNDGLRVAEITVGGKRMDLTLSGPEERASKTQTIENLPIVTGSGQILPVSALARIDVTAGPTEILHLEGERTVVLELRPQPDLPLQAVVDLLQTQVVDALRKEGVPTGVRMRLAGTAEKLTRTWRAMQWQFLLAVVTVYLVMVVLLESFVFPLIIMLSVPLATSGGVAGLAVLNQFHHQPLDMLTLLGFVILVGIVVNNSILLVHQTLQHARREGMGAGEAIVAATRDRMRPIFLSTLTSVFGMLPLVVFPGAGSELYRGLGSVVVGGLSLSALLTMVVVPPLLALAAPLIPSASPAAVATAAPGDRRAAE